MIRQRPGLEIQASPNWQEFDIETMQFKDVPAERMKSTDYLYIL